MLTTCITLVFIAGYFIAFIEDLCVKGAMDVEDCEIAIGFV